MSKEEPKKYTVSTIFPNEEIMNDALNRKSADEMFKELGYEKQEDNKFFITYIKRKEYVTYRIVFCIEQKCIEFCNDSDGYFTRFNPEELQAINEKCRELGWL